MAASRPNASCAHVARRTIQVLAERAGEAVVSAGGEGNGDAPADVLMLRVCDVFADYERLIIRTRTRAALTAKRARCERTGDVPFGYRLAEDGVHLVEAEQEQAVVRELSRFGGAGVVASRHLRAALRGEARAALGAWHPQKVARIPAPSRR